MSRLALWTLVWGNKLGLGDMDQKSYLVILRLVSMKWAKCSRQSHNIIPLNMPDYFIQDASIFFPGYWWKYPKIRSVSKCQSGKKVNPGSAHPFTEYYGNMSCSFCVFFVILKCMLRLSAGGKLGHLDFRWFVPAREWHGSKFKKEKIPPNSWICNKILWISSYWIICLTNKPTNQQTNGQGWRHSLLGRGNNSTMWCNIKLNCSLNIKHIFSSYILLYSISIYLKSQYTARL